MIARIWKGETRVEDVEAYTRYLEETGVRAYRATEGNRGVQLLVRRGPERAEFLLLTYWESWDAVRRFAGPDVDVPVYYPEDERYLLTFADRVEHYEVHAA